MRLHLFGLYIAFTAQKHKWEVLIMRKYSKFLTNQDGQGVMEYILLSSLIGIFCLLALRNYGNGLRKQINYFKKEINSLPRR